MLGKGTYIYKPGTKNKKGIRDPSCVFPPGGVPGRGGEQPLSTEGNKSCKRHVSTQKRENVFCRLSKGGRGTTQERERTSILGDITRQRSQGGGRSKMVFANKKKRGEGLSGRKGNAAEGVWTLNSREKKEGQGMGAGGTADGGGKRKR